MIQEMDPTEERYTAIHEAGHAVVAVLVGKELRSITLGIKHLPNGKIASGTFNCGMLNVSEIARHPELATPHIMVHLAGPLAEGKVNPQIPAPSMQIGDYRTAMELAALATGKIMRSGPRQPQRLKIDDAQRDAFYTEAAKKADALIVEHWPKIKAVADILQMRRAMTGQEVADLIGTNPDSV